MTRVLTLQNMHEVNLQRHYDGRVLNRWTSMIVHYARKITKQKLHITLADVYNEFAKGKKFHEVKNSLQLKTQSIDQIDVLNNTVLIGQIFYHASNPGIQDFDREGVPTALCDENIAEHNAIDGAQRVFGYATHTVFEGLNGQCDTRVWKKGLDFDFIISKDRAVKLDRVTPEKRDLTNCAYDTWKEILSRNGGIIDEEIHKLPIIIHIMNHNADGRTVKRLLQKNKKEILRLSKERKSPVIELKKGRQARIGKHYLELIDGDTSEKKQQLIDSRYDEFLKSDPLNLGSKTILEYSSTVRDLIKMDVNKIINEYSDPGLLIPVLNDYINRVKTVGCLTETSKNSLLFQIEEDRPIKEFYQHMQRRRLARGYAPNGLCHVA